MKEDQIMGKALFWSWISCTMVIFKSVQTEMWKKEKKEEKKKSDLLKCFLKVTVR